MTLGLEVNEQLHNTDTGSVDDKGVHRQNVCREYSRFNMSLHLGRRAITERLIRVGHARRRHEPWRLAKPNHRPPRHNDDNCDDNDGSTDGERNDARDINARTGRSTCNGGLGW